MRPGRLLRAIRLRRVGALLGALLALTVAWQHWAARRPADLEGRMAARGAALYGDYCGVCHGAALEGGVPFGGVISPPLLKWGFRIFFWTMPAGMEGFVRDQVAKGEGKMPPFETLLSPEEVEALALYIRLANTGGLPAP